MNPPRFHPSLDHHARAFAQDFLGAILQAADPASALESELSSYQPTHPTHILAFGKASIPMTHAAIESLGPLFARATVLAPESLINQSQFKSRFVELLAADHPLPTIRSIESTAKLIEHAKSIPSDHQTLILISGGSSAMLCQPSPNSSLEEIINTTQSMLQSGASITEINKARSKFDTIKLGGLAKLLVHTQSPEAFVLSDVIGDDLYTIGSGPAMSDQYPIPHTIVANNDRVCDAAIAFLGHEHINLIAATRQATGFVSTEADRFVKPLVEANAQYPIASILGGEPTVDASGATGSGGPMTELAITSAVKLIDAPFRWTLVTFATDGIDGPTDAAGAIITSEMLTDPTIRSALGQSLKEHDALTMCDTIGATIRTGATGSNVNDIALAIRWD